MLSHLEFPPRGSALLTVASIGRVVDTSTALDAPISEATVLNRHSSNGTMRKQKIRGKFELPIGKLKWFDVAKGFGFIVPDDGGGDVYLSAKAVEEARLPTLVPGMALRYEISEARGKKAATRLSALSPSKTVDPLEDFEHEWGLRPS